MTKPPSERHCFGTDQIGRDMLSRVIYGSRASLTVALGAVAVRHDARAPCGASPAAISAGASTSSASACIEFMQSFPDLILAMAIAMALGAGTGTVIVAIAITRIPFGGRVIRVGRAVGEGDAFRRGGARPRRLASAHHGAAHPAAMHRPLS